MIISWFAAHLGFPGEGPRVRHRQASPTSFLTFNAGGWKAAFTAFQEHCRQSMDEAQDVRLLPSVVLFQETKLIAQQEVAFQCAAHAHG
jgi:hypothetical protein